MKNKNVSYILISILFIIVFAMAVSAGECCIDDDCHDYPYCDAGYVMTQDGICVNGSCILGIPYELDDCNDGNLTSCDGSWVIHTTEVCSEDDVAHCVVASSTEDCNDDLFCNGVETCEGEGVCTEPYDVCDDGDTCLDTCDEESDICNYDVNDTTNPVTSALDVFPWFNGGIFDITATVTDECSVIETATYYVGYIGTADCDANIPYTVTGEILPEDDTSYDLDKLVEYLLKKDMAYLEHDGPNWVCVEGMANDLWSNCECLYFQQDLIIPEEPIDPAINGIINADELLVCGTDPLLTGKVCDTQSEIQGGEYFLDLTLPPLPAPWSGEWMAASESWIEGVYHCANISANINLSLVDDNTHTVTFRGKDIKEWWGKMLSYDLSFIKDTTPPKTAKILNPMDNISLACLGNESDVLNHQDLPANINLDAGCYYVKSGTTIDLDARDFNPDDSTDQIGVGIGYNNLPGEYDGNVIINYKIWWSLNGTEWEVIEEGQSNVDEPLNFSLQNDSYHLIEYWSVDGTCGNEETHHFELDIVDTQKPYTEKTIKGPQLDGPGMVHKYLTYDSTITLECVDPEPHPVNEANIQWSMWWAPDCDPNDMENASWQFMEEGMESDGVKIFSQLNDSCHKFTYHCEDALLNIEEPNTEYDIVDNQAPIIEKMIVGPYVGDCPPQQIPLKGCDNNECPEQCIIDGVTEIHVNFTDPQPHPVDDVVCKWDYSVEGGVKIGDGQDNITSPFIINFPEESYHYLLIECWDALGNYASDYEMFEVDKTPPETTKWYEGPMYPLDIYHPDYINNLTVIHLNATDDIGPHNSGVVATYYRVSLVDDINCYEECLANGTGNFSTYIEPFSIIEDSCHMIEYYSIDGVNKTEDLKKQCVFVENVAPVVNKTVGEPKVASLNITEYLVPEKYDVKDDAWYVTQNTEITLSCEDLGDHPVNEVTIYYWYYNDGQIVQPITEYDGPFTYDEDTYHELYYYCVDALGNKGEVHYELDMVDTQPPELSKVIGEPHEIVCEFPKIKIDSTLGESVREGDVYEPLDLLMNPLITSPCDSATNPSQCAWLDINNLPPFAAATVAAQGTVINPDCGNVLILSSGNPLDADTYISTNMGNPGCGTNPDGYGTHDCTQILDYTPESDSVVLAISSEWKEYLNSKFTDWMQIGGVLDISINDWVGHPSLVDMPGYNPSGSGSVSLAILASTESVDLRIADSGDSKYDTAFVIVPVSCFEEPPQLMYCGNNQLDPGEQCDDGNNVSNDGCSSICLSEYCGDSVLQPGLGEQCDDGNNFNGDGCDEFCQTEDMPPDCIDYITQQTNITFHCEDMGEHPVNDVTIEYRSRWKYDFNDTWGNWSDWVEVFDTVATFTFDEDSIHELEYRCNDSLGNEYESQFELDVVDTQAPESWKDLEGSVVDCSADDIALYGYEDCAYITQNTQVNLICEDLMPHPVDDVELHYRVDWKENWGDNWSLGEEFVSDEIAQFSYKGDSFHLLTWWCVDALGNTEKVHQELDIVDTQAPIVTKTIGEPKVTDDSFAYGAPVYGVASEDGIFVWKDEATDDYHIRWTTDWSKKIWRNVIGTITSSTEITNLVEVSFDGNGGLPDDTSSQDAPNKISFDAWVDNGEDGIDFTTDGEVVFDITWDGNYTPELVFIGAGEVNPFTVPFMLPYVFINMSTEIQLECVDVEPHPVDDVTIRHRINGGNWTESSGLVTFSYQEDSMHILEWSCVDALGNMNYEFIEVDYVDSQAPVTEKTVGTPKIAGEGDIHWWITQQTEIELDCSDLYPHPVNDVTLYYRNYKDGETVPDFTEVEIGNVVFSNTEDCNHTVEWYCVDALSNAEELQIEHDNVDTAAPNITKFIRIDGGERLYEGQYGVQSFVDIKLCAEVIDYKMTGDEGVGVDEVWGRTSVLDDPQMTLDKTEGENTYCFTMTTNESCGMLHYEVMANDSLGNTRNWTNGITIIIDNVPPIGKVLTPHSGQFYRNGIPFWIYAPAVDFGGNECCNETDEDCIENEECPASGVAYCDFYGIDYNFEGMNQSEIKACYQDLDIYFDQILAEPTIEYLGRVPYEDGVCDGQVALSENSNLTGVAFLGVKYVDKAGNGNDSLQLALNPWFSPITMNIDNEGPLVLIANMGNLPGPVTSDQTVFLTAEVVEYKSGFDDCWADIYTYVNGSIGEDTNLDLDGVAVDFNKCEISGQLPHGIESGEYILKVNARDEKFNIGYAEAYMLVDNLRPTMSVVSPSPGEVYSAMFPVSLHVEDNMVGVANETVMVKISEVPLLGNLWCVFGNCESTGWVTLTEQGEGLFADTLNLSGLNISGVGRYVFDAVACDRLYVSEPDTALGFSLGNSQTDMHCRMISEHGNVDQESRPECNDGIDNDCDGSIDFPEDEGCTNSSDNDESNALPVCGNGILEAGEECDDNNTQDGDGCSAVCLEESTCTDSKLYTLDVDFDEGILVNVEHDTVHDQLQVVPGVLTVLPTMWVANAGEDSISKWDTENNVELARYHTWFGSLANHNSWSGAAPSRTAVDEDGNAYVANRHFDSYPSDVFKIYTDDWIDRNGNGVLDTSFDANADDEIDASEMLPFYDNNSNGVIDDEEITDERIAWVAAVGPTNCLGRSLAIDLDGNIWLGCYSTKTYYKLDGDDGSIIAGPISTPGHSPYGALVDKNGILWGASLGGNLLKLDTNTDSFVGTFNPSGSYGIALGYDNSGNTLVYLGGTSSTFSVFNSSSETFSTPAAVSYYTRGIATDADGNILAGRESDGSVTKFAPNGTVIWYGAPQVNADARGTVVDANGDVWIIHNQADKISKFNGSTGAPLGIRNSGHGPYTYSDATGVGFGSSVTLGTWNVIFDSKETGTSFGAITWNDETTENSSIEFKVRVSNDMSTWSPWQVVENSVAFNTTLIGQYLEVMTTMKILSGDVSPILYDLEVEGTCG